MNYHLFVTEEEKQGVTLKQDESLSLMTTTLRYLTPLHWLVLALLGIAGWQSSSTILLF